MGIWELLLIAVGLSMDAAAVSMSNGMCFHRAGVKEAGRIAGAFGIFQGIMPLIGYYACSFFEREITSLDHWVALILLGFSGGKMIWESHAGHEVSHECVTLSGKLLSVSYTHLKEGTAKMRGVRPTIRGGEVEKARVRR